ncbi:hypothetical protein [Roseimaritima sediminicola]|uniref:hypothetical protein n=1 Tax=Roseimaritima sediminicola TaxID=2662066 RepID=UPI0012983973|nr:hypothetical protein [Roseimaritima sediminicola]
MNRVRSLEMARCRLRAAVLLPLLGCALSATAGALTAPASEPWVRVEEDWTLVLNEPDPELHSPQLSIYVTPDPDRIDAFFQVQLNHAADTTFAGGGFRVAAFREDRTVDEAVSETRTALSHHGDTIQWTNVFAIRDDRILFAIKDGQSQSWGAFGGPDYLLSVPADGQSDFRSYSPYQSAREVDLGFGKNRVASLTLQCVRVYRSDGTFELVPVRLTVK